MKTKTLVFIAMYIFIWYFFLLGYALGERYGYVNYSFGNYEPEQSETILQIDKCSNLSSLQITSECLIKEMSEFYIYNGSNAYLYWNNGKPDIKDWNKIKGEGGVCWHFAEWYAMRAEQLGLNGDLIIVEYDDLSYNHAIVMITNNKNEYCLIDQTTLVGCHKTGIVNFTEVENE